MNQNMYRTLVCFLLKETGGWDDKEKQYLEKIEVISNNHLESIEKEKVREPTNDLPNVIGHAASFRLMLDICRRSRNACQKQRRT